jgi:hypothetical protein
MPNGSVVYSSISIPLNKNLDDKPPYAFYSSRYMEWSWLLKAFFWAFNPFKDK